MEVSISDFATTAKGFTKNPLGIIALFIVLIYGFASLTLGLTTSLGSVEKIMLVAFLVIFPCIVLASFVWLVCEHHEKLYGPSDYKSDISFLEASKNKLIKLENLHNAEIQNAKDTFKEVIRSKPGVLSESIEDLTRLFLEQIQENTTFTVDASNYLNDPNAVFQLPFSGFESLGDLTDAVYFKLAPKVRPFEYGYTWVLKDDSTNEVIRTTRMITNSPQGIRLPDLRSLDEVGIQPGTILIVDKPQSIHK